MSATNRERFFKKYNLPSSASPSLQDIQKLTGVPMSILKAVESRGRGAYGGNITSVRLQDGTKNFNPAIPRSARMSIGQWSRARLYSFLMKGTTYYTADADLAKKAGF